MSSTKIKREFDSKVPDGFQGRGCTESNKEFLESPFIFDEKNEFIQLNTTGFESDNMENNVDS